MKQALPFLSMAFLAFLTHVLNGQTTFVGTPVVTPTGTACSGETINVSLTIFETSLPATTNVFNFATPNGYVDAVQLTETRNGLTGIELVTYNYELTLAADFPGNAFDFILIVFNPNGLVFNSEISEQVNFANTIAVEPLPDISLVAEQENNGDALLCLPPGATVPGSTTVDLAATVSNSNQLTQPLQYQWLFNNVPVPNAVLPGFAADRPGTYELEVASLNCFNNKARAAIDVITQPATALNQPPDVTACDGAMVTLLTNPAEPGAVFQWLRSDLDADNFTPVPGANAPVLTLDALSASDEGKYQLEANLNGCTEQTLPIVVNLVDPGLSMNTASAPDISIDGNTTFTYNQVFSNTEGPQTEIDWIIGSESVTVTADQPQVSGTLPNVEGSGKPIDYTVINTPQPGGEVRSELQILNINAGDQVTVPISVSARSLDETMAACVSIGPFDLGTLSLLPVEWLYIRAQPVEEGVLVEWATASELNNDYFTVERSIDGADFTPIGKVPGVGTAHAVQSYQWVDRNIPSGGGDGYYRIKQTDFDGQYAYSDMAVVPLGATNVSKALFHWIQSETLVIQLTAHYRQSAQVLIFDMNGRALVSQRVQLEQGPNTFGPSVALLPRGVYMLQIIGEQTSHSSLFLK